MAGEDVLAENSVAEPNHPLGDSHRRAATASKEGPQAGARLSTERPEWGWRWAEARAPYFHPPG